MKTLLARIAAHRAKIVTFCDGCGQVSTPARRSAAHIARVTTAAYRTRL